MDFAARRLGARPGQGETRFEACSGGRGRGSRQAVRKQAEMCVSAEQPVPHDRDGIVDLVDYL